MRTIEERRASARECMRRTRARRRSEGKCHECEELAIVGTIFCPRHTAQNRANVRPHRERHYARGMCAFCHEPATSATLCDRHRAEHTAYQQRRRMEKKP
jgi:hypothetical protein